MEWVYLLLEGYVVEHGVIVDGCMSRERGDDRQEHTVGCRRGVLEGRHFFWTNEQWITRCFYACMCACARVCVCTSVCARARVCVCVWWSTSFDKITTAWLSPGINATWVVIPFRLPETGEYEITEYTRGRNRETVDRTVSNSNRNEFHPASTVNYFTG